MSDDKPSLLKMCINKWRAPTKREAERKAAQVLRTFGSRQRAYYCSLCGGYHLTTKDVFR